jgi:hypothetical protein
MTMSRDKKNKQDRVLKGLDKVKFASPKLARQAKADRGHTEMTPVEYAEHRLGRGRKVSAETAMAHKLDRQGWIPMANGGYRRTERY